MDIKKSLFIIGATAVLTSISLGQDARSANSKVNSRGGAAANGNASASAGKKEINAGTALQGQLQNTVDVRKSRVGDEVVLKTLRAVKQNGQTVIPKGSQLIGRVTEISQRSKNNAESRIGILFDRINGGGLSQPITASIVSITSFSSAASVGNDLFDSEISGSSKSSGSVSRGSSAGGGGLLGGGLLGGATSTLGSVANTATNTVGGVTNTVGNTSRSLGTAVNGLKISGAASGSANGSSTISSGDKNLHIDKGATFNLMINN